MRLDRWISRQGYGALSQLARDTGLSYGTIYAAYSRSACTTYQSAALIEKATKGAVTIAEICSARPIKRKRAA